MKFVTIPGMKIVELGATVADCKEFKESAKRGYLVKDVLPEMGTDGTQVFVALIYAKYPNQKEYQKMHIVMEDIPEFACEVSLNMDSIQSSLRTWHCFKF